MNVIQVLQRQRLVPVSSTLLFAFILLASIPTHAQTFRGGINGTLEDGTGAVLSDARITATDEATGVVHSTVTSAAGSFIFQDLPLGIYKIHAEDTGFRPLDVSGVTVSAGTIHTLSLQLSVSDLSTTVEVSAAAIALDTTATQQATVLAEQSLQDLPLNGRDFKKIVGVVPGFAGYTGVLGSVNGARTNQTNWQIDGTDNNDLWANNSAINQSGIGGIAGTALPIDAIDQFSLQTQSTVETGRNPGAIANVVVKSGSNRLHGSAYYYNRNEALAANPVFVPETKQRFQSYGFSLGGPIRHDHTFYFTSFERQQFVLGVLTTGTEPSAAYQSEAKSLLAANNIAVNPLSTALLGLLWPASALTGPATANNYVPPAENGFDNNGVVKLDHSFNDKNNISARWVVGQGNQTAPVGSYLKSYYEVAPIHVQNYSVVYNRVFTPRLANQLLFGVSSYNQVFSDFDHSFDVNSLGLITGAQKGAPAIKISGFDQTGETPPEGRNDITAHVTEALSYNIGAHQFRFGGEFRKAQLDEFYYRNGEGTFSFDGSQGSYKINPYTDSNVKALADYLAGKVVSSSLARGDAERLVYVNSYNLFAQDAWQLTRRLNLNYGIRYDYEGPLHNGKNDLPTFVPSKGGLVVQGNGIGSLFPPQHTNFAPRVGFSFQPRENKGLVIRGAYGIFFDATSLSPFLDNRPGNGGPNGFEGNPAGTSPVQTISQNAYIWQSGSPLFTGGPASIVGLFSVSQNFKTPITSNYSFNIEQALGSKAVFSLGYVGSQSRHQVATVDINQAGLNPASPTNSAVGILGGKPGSVQQSSRPYYAQFPNYGVINQVESIGNSNYNALEATLRSSSWHGLNSQFNYTWSHNLDDVTAYRSKLPQNSNNFGSEYSNSDYDTRHAFNGTVNYDVPTNPHAPKVIAQGWQLNSLINLHGGAPFNITTSSDLTGTNEGYERPNLIGNPFAVSHSFVPTATSRYVQWINSAAFAAPAAGHFGTLRRNAYYGPGYASADLSAFKNTRISERVTTQFRAELYNITNRVNLAAPSASFGSSSFGHSSDTIGDYNGAPAIGPGEPFNTQLALKILF